MSDERETMEWSLGDDYPPLFVYVDQVLMLQQDVLVYNNVYLKPDEHGVYERIDPLNALGLAPEI